MKLGEALIIRAELKKEIESLKQRAIASSTAQEGDTPPENTNGLMNEIIDKLNEYKDLIQAIDYTNSVTDFDFGETLSNALVRREILNELIRAYQTIVSNVDGSNAWGKLARVTRSEIKTTIYIDIADYRKKINNVAKELRNIDLQIQRINWQIDLLGTKEQKSKEAN